MDQAHQVLQEGDYLRIFHSPRRFPTVYQYQWTLEKLDGGVVVAKNETKGYWIVDKPPNVPVHPTTDNIFENVAECIRRELLHHDNPHHCNNDDNNDDNNHNNDNTTATTTTNAYVATPQRLDQNTSGLLVIARSKQFAAYYAKLLRDKTNRILLHNEEEEEQGRQVPQSGIQKVYRCLVCLQPPPPSSGSSSSSSSSSWSMASALARLQSTEIMTHYLEPSLRAPRRFAASPMNETWLECRMRIVSVGEAYPVVGRRNHGLALGLWHRAECVPPQCVGVVEVEVELLTGRTHQIRGQLAAEGYALVGDVQYGGASPPPHGEKDQPDQHYAHSERLALQSCKLQFLDPDEIVLKDGTTKLVQSKRWNSFELTESWWTRLLQENKTPESATTSSVDLEKALNINKGFPVDKDDDEAEEEVAVVEAPKAELMPPPVELADGVHKYVLVKAVHPSTPQEEQWFVKSCSAKDCGGPYHADVALDLVEWLRVLDFDVTVTGGGRISYKAARGRAKVYGLSYGFGKADHAKTALLIAAHTDIIATFDNSDRVY